MNKIISYKDTDFIEDNNEKKSRLIILMNALYDKVNNLSKNQNDIDKTITEIICLASDLCTFRYYNDKDTNNYADYHNKIASKIDAIGIIIKHINDDNKEHIIKLCNTIWHEALNAMSSRFKFEYKTNK